MTSFVVDFDETAREIFVGYMRSQGVLAGPISQQIQHVSDPLVTRTRRELVANSDWYRSASFNEYRR
jgi:hypothetical protein